ncbi:biotin--[acetyl-CoA-carboxylase] ligase [Bacillus solitudinis]|uniref:biotin--[acetyl-CoA-carboxylase] ligase n=1 Tax=Bacillus solitudinis TaxID=2014074 RepID=UPI000C2380D0|nr:biotin--[acetyl-CoA-carboxylase] ligase [Bacillus solitudinis]
MREKLLKILLQHKDGFVSGEKISLELGCSRTAVWKHIEELRKDGYEVDSAPRKGYRIIKKANGIQSHEVNIHLETERIGRSISYYDAIDSTQIIAHKLAQEGMEEGHIVIANEQTSGRGRLGRSWYSKGGTSISMSLILRPKLSPQQTPQLTLLSAVAVIRGVKKITGIDCEIKWPNDVLINGKKIVGILTEMQSDPDYVHSVIIGIGLNVNQQTTDFEPDIQRLATSLSIETGQQIERSRLIAAILGEFEWLYDEYLENGFSMIRGLWEAHAVSVGTYIYARTPKQVIYGYAQGITDEGVLLVQDEQGTIHHIYSADIEIAKQT